MDHPAPPLDPQGAIAAPWQTPVVLWLCPRVQAACGPGREAVVTRRGGTMDTRVHRCVQPSAGSHLPPDHPPLRGSRLAPQVLPLGAR